MIDYVKEKAAERPVLVHCDENLKELFREQHIEYIDVDDPDRIDHDRLRNLDAKPASDLYPIILCSDASLGMRGLDYRAPEKGICLLVAKSFRHEREAIQGLHRVGRQADPWERNLMKGLPLVDKDQ